MLSPAMNHPRRLVPVLALVALAPFVVLAWRSTRDPLRAAPNSGAADGAGARAPIPAKLELLAAEALARPGAFAMLESLCNTAPHRLAGSPGAENAVHWAEETMRSIGLENVRVEPCLVPRWERGSVARLALAPGQSGGDEVYSVLALGGSPGTPAGGLEAEVVRVERLEDVAALGERARGKAIFFDRPMDPSRPDPFSAYGGAVDQRALGSQTAARAGAAFAIVRSMTLARDDHPHTGSMRTADGPIVPAVAIGTLGAERLAARLAKGAPVRLRLDLDCATRADVPSANVVGEIVGRERPEEIVVLRGNLDAWDVGQGAHDDGAGCVHALEALRLVRVLGWQPRRTLRVVLWMNEENGTRGAQAYRDAHADELARHVLALESDRGGFAPRGFDCTVGTPALARLAAIGRELEPYGIGFVRSSPHSGVDIGPLAEQGVPCVGFVPDPTRYFDVHHSAADVLSAVHPRELELGALCIAWLVVSVADDEQPLDRTPPAAAPKPAH